MRTTHTHTRQVFFLRNGKERLGEFFSKSCEAFSVENFGDRRVRLARAARAPTESPIAVLVTTSWLVVVWCVCVCVRLHVLVCTSSGCDRR